MFIRNDLRNSSDMRLISAEYGIVKDADSSVSYSAGNNLLIVSLYGPMQPRYSRHELYDDLSIEVEIARDTITGDSTVGSYIEKDISSIVKDVVSAVICTNKYPKLLLILRISIVRSDGSILESIINACSCLLNNSRLVSGGVFGAVTILPAEVDNQLVLLVDPNSEEEEKFGSEITYCYLYAQNEVLNSYARKGLLFSSGNLCYVFNHVKIASNNSPSPVNITGSIALLDHVEGLAERSVDNMIEYLFKEG